MKHDIRNLFLCAGLMLLAAGIAPALELPVNAMLATAADAAAEAPKNEFTWKIDAGYALMIFFGCWPAPLMLAWMAWQLYREKRRQLEPLEVPAGSPPFDHNAASFSPEMAEVLEFQATLQTRSIEGFEGPVPVISSRKEIEKAYEILERMRGKKDVLNSHSIHAFNTMLSELNAAQKRYVNSSILGLLILGGWFVLIAALLFYFSAFLSGLSWLALGGVCYLTMQCPAYKLAQDAPYY